MADVNARGPVFLYDLMRIGALLLVLVARGSSAPGLLTFPYRFLLRWLSKGRTTAVVAELARSARGAIESRIDSDSRFCSVLAA